MLTYIGMTLPMEVFALITWLRHPYQGNKSEVVCFAVFLANDIYGFISWKRMGRKQADNNVISACREN